MLARTVHEVFDTLSAAGLSVALTPELGLSVSPTRLLTDHLRGVIREHKLALVEFLREAANDPSSPETKPAPADSTAAPAPDWRQADADYLRHHWQCPSCCAAGHGRGDRCATGAQLWAAYQAAWSAAQPIKTQGRNSR